MKVFPLYSLLSLLEHDMLVFPCSQLEQINDSFYSNIFYRAFEVDHIAAHLFPVTNYQFLFF